MTEKDKVLEIRDSAVDVDDASVERMVNESIENAFEDMNERILAGRCKYFFMMIL